jgi:hypothetical protein
MSARFFSTYVAGARRCTGVASALAACTALAASRGSAACDAPPAPGRGEQARSTLSAREMDQLAQMSRQARWDGGPGAQAPAKSAVPPRAPAPEQLGDRLARSLGVSFEALIAGMWVRGLPRGALGCLQDDAARVGA